MYIPDVFQNMKLSSIFSCEEILLEVFIDSAIKKIYSFYLF